jgi:hypothetical protein
LPDSSSCKLRPINWATTKPPKAEFSEAFFSETSKGKKLEIVSENNPFPERESEIEKNSSLLG